MKIAVIGKFLSKENVSPGVEQKCILDNVILNNRQENTDVTVHKVLPELVEW